jgi:RimJ/RimL family protein N-acetyltransferase
MTISDLQPILQNEQVIIRPLLAEDFARLYAIGSDPLIWEQHPNPDRYKIEVFTNFFDGALASGGAFLVSDAHTGQPIGSSRFYDWNPQDASVFIGYTFLARTHWGGPYNKALKTLMIDHALAFAEKVYFHIGANNIRSQRSMERLGGLKTGEIQVAYYQEPTRHNYVYEIDSKRWQEVSGAHR